MTDIDKLHGTIEQIVNKNPRGRAHGFTTAYIELMVGELWVGDPGLSYAYVGENRQIAETTCRRFKERASAEGFTPVRATRDYLEFHTGQRFWFYGASQIAHYHAIRGMSFSRVFIDVALDAKSVDFKDKIMRELQPLLAMRENDYV